METKKHARELVTSSSSARVSNKSLMLILILISTLALIIFTPTKVKAAYNGTIGEMPLWMAKAIKAYYTEDRLVNQTNASATQQNYENALNVYNAITAEDIQNMWNDSVYQIMSGETIFDTTWEDQVNILILGYNNILRISFFFTSDGSNTDQMQMLEFWVPDTKMGFIRGKGGGTSATPIYRIIQYDVSLNNQNEIQYSLYRNQNTANYGQSFYRYSGENMQYTTSGDRLFVEGLLNLGQNIHDFEIYFRNESKNYYQGYYLGEFTNTEPTPGPSYPTNSGYTGTIYNESGDITGTISGEIDNENIIGALTDVPDLSGETISSGEIEQAVGVQLTADPYDNFWYQFSTGIASALTASTASMEINWLGTRQTITSDMFDLPLPQDIKNLITVVSNVTLCWLMLKWTKEIVDGIHEGGILHIVHRGWESYTAYM